MGQISTHSPHCVHLFSGSIKSNFRFSPIGVGGDINKFSGHTSTQSLHLIHKMLSTAIFFKGGHYNMAVAYFFNMLNLKLSKNKFQIIPTRWKSFLNVKIF